MNYKMLSIFLFAGIAISLTGCRKKYVEEEKVIIEKRVSGPLSDPHVKWSKEDYR